MIKKDRRGLFKSMLKTLVLFLLVSLSLSVFHLFELHAYDKEFHLERLFNLAEQIKQGVWKPIVTPFILDGYGYATDLFYGNFYLYPFAWLIAMGVNHKISFFLLNVTINLMTLWIAYLSANKLFLFFDKELDPSKAHQRGVLFSLASTLFISRIFNVFIRCLIGEMMGSAFLPIVFIGICDFLKGKPKKMNIYLVAGFSFTLITHIISFVINVTVFLVFLILNYKAWVLKKEKWVELLASVLASIGITAFFLFPLAEQLLSNEFRYQTYNPHGLLSEHSFLILPTNSIFIPCLIQTILIFGLLKGFKYSKKLKKEERFIAKTFMLFIYSLTLSTNLFPWPLFDHVFPINMIQFPFRLLNWSSVFLGIGVTFFFLTQPKFLNIEFSSFKKQIMIILGPACLSIMICLTQAKFIEWMKEENKKLEELGFLSVLLNSTEKMDLMPEKIQAEIGQGEYLPSQLNLELLTKRSDELIINNQTSTLFDYRMNGLSYEWTNDRVVNDVQIIKFPVVFYKGYVVEINHEQIPITQSSDGLIQIEFSQPISLDKDTVLTVNYQGTTLQSMSYWISLGTFTLVVVTMIKKRKE